MYDSPVRSLAESMWLAEPQEGDFEQGVGVSTQQLQNPNTSLPRDSAGSGAAGPFQSPAVWAVVVALLIAVKLITEKAGEKSEFSTVRIGLENWLVVGLLAATFLYVFRVTAYSFGWVPGAVKQFAGAL